MLHNCHNRDLRTGVYASLKRIKSDTAANAVMECAVILALIVGVVLVGGRLIGGATESAFSRVLAASGPDSNSAATAKAAASHSHATASTPESAALSQYRLLATELVAFAALIYVWYMSRVRRKEHELLGSDDEVPTVITQTLQQNVHFKKRQAIYRLLAQDMQAVLASRMEVRHVMSPNATTVTADVPADEVVRRMDQDRFRHLLVVDGDGRLVGIISDRDLLRPAARTASDLMTANPFTVTHGSLISPAVTLMIEKRISCLPVVELDQTVCGVLTTTDLMMALQCSLQILHKFAAESSASDNGKPDFLQSTSEETTKSLREEHAELVGAGDERS